MINSNSDVYRNFIQHIYNEGIFDSLTEYVATRFVEHQKGVYPPTIEGLTTWITTLRETFSDLHITISELVETEDRTWSRLIMEGKQVKDFMGIEAAGKYFIIDVIEECRFHDFRIVEHWGVFDRFALLQQINSGQKLVLPFGG
ncbi:MAG: ester cyclase [Chitinispirillaceae bacterium]|nr:ester cyclase [Chitinispirillaceae bacterium]